MLILLTRISFGAVAVSTASLSVGARTYISGLVLWLTHSNLTCQDEAFRKRILAETEKIRPKGEAGMAVELMEAAPAAVESKESFSFTLEAPAMDWNRKVSSQQEVTDERDYWLNKVDTRSCAQLPQWSAPVQESSINCIRLSCVSFRMKCKSTKDNTFTAAAKTLVPQGCLRIRPTMTTDVPAASPRWCGSGEHVCISSSVPVPWRRLINALALRECACVTCPKIAITHPSNACMLHLLDRLKRLGEQLQEGMGKQWLGTKAPLHTLKIEVSKSLNPSPQGSRWRFMKVRESSKGYQIRPLHVCIYEPCYGMNWFQQTTNQGHCFGLQKKEPSRHVSFKIAHVRWTWARVVGCHVSFTTSISTSGSHVSAMCQSVVRYWRVKYYRIMSHYSSILPHFATTLPSPPNPLLLLHCWWATLGESQCLCRMLLPAGHGVMVLQLGFSSCVRTCRATTLVVCLLRARSISSCFYCIQSRGYALLLRILLCSAWSGLEQLAWRDSTRDLPTCGSCRTSKVKSQVITNRQSWAKSPCRFPFCERYASTLMATCFTMLDNTIWVISSRRPRAPLLDGCIRRRNDSATTSGCLDGSGQEETAHRRWLPEGPCGVLIRCCKGLPL